VYFYLISCELVINFTNIIISNFELCFIDIRTFSVSFGEVQFRVIHVGPTHIGTQKSMFSFLLLSDTSIADLFYVFLKLFLYHFKTNRRIACSVLEKLQNFWKVLDK
jgi:hypothetical protein